MFQDGLKQYLVEDDLEFLILLPPTGITGMCHCWEYLVWEWNPGLHTHWTSILPTEPQLRPGFPLSLLGLDNGAVPDFNISSVQSFVHWTFSLDLLKYSLGHLTLAHMQGLP